MAYPTETQFSRRRVAAWTSGAVLFFLALLFGLNPGSDTAPAPSFQQEAAAEIEQDAVTDQQEEVSQEQVPEYQIVYELSDKRYDGGKSFYILVASIDLSTDHFKNDIKNAVDEIVKSKGRKISIDFVNDRSTLDLIYKSHYGNNTLGRTLTNDEMNDIGNALVARFDGQLDSALYLNSIDFFPGTSSDNPGVGKYVETIEYDPGE